MGFYSWDCEECGKSLKNEYTDTPKEQRIGTALLENGSIIHGEYTGYGSLEDLDISDGSPTIYHKACWVKAGKPTEYKGESPSAGDQGYFGSEEADEDCDCLDCTEGDWQDDDQS
jgi:hypothetical protein